jgi:hypothetical protein
VDTDDGDDDGDGLEFLFTDGGGGEIVRKKTERAIKAIICNSGHVQQWIAMLFVYVFN